MRHSTTERREQLFAEAAAIIGCEYGAALQVDAVARRLATSRRQLQRAFEEAGGTSFIAYLTEVRLQRARQLLLETDLSVKAIAQAVGYRRSAHFAVRFRDCFGASPREFRKARPRLGGGGPLRAELAYREAHALRVA